MSTLSRVLDERDPAGGRLKGLVFLTHPGPSLLVTAVTVGAAALVARGRLPAGSALALVVMMLPMQLAIGALNDWADVGSDRVAKPFKPLVRGHVSRRAALLLAVSGFAVSLATAAHWNPTFLLIDLLGVAAGAAYDLGLKRGPLSFLCLAGGLECVALMATTAGDAGGGLLTLPLAALLGLALHVSNALPDIEGDRAAGARTVPVVLGARPARIAAAVAALLGAVSAWVIATVAHLGGGARAAAVALVLAGLLLGLAPEGVLRRAGFPATALLAGVAAVAWLSALPPPAA